MKSDCIDHGRSKSLRPEGYAMVGIPGVRSRCTGLHRLVYVRTHGLSLSDIKGQVIMHTCDNPRCINPKHLRVGSRADNNRDRAAKGRSAKRVPSRQRLTSEQCAVIRARYSSKRCKISGVTALAREYGVDSNVIYSVVRGTYAR